MTDTDHSECEAEFIDGSWYGDDCPECRDAVDRASDECEECIAEANGEDGAYCSFHVNGCY